MLQPKKIITHARENISSSGYIHHGKAIIELASINRLMEMGTGNF